jgi:hypothetical protein
MLERPPAARRRAARAARDRAYRRRRDACRIMVPVELGGEELEMLLRLGYLLEEHAADRAAIGRAAAHALAVAARS